MKKVVILLVVCLASYLIVNGQKESGTVYSEHEAIAKTKAMWTAFVKGDKETFAGFFADSIWENSNGDFQLRLKKDVGRYVDFWKGVEDFLIQDDQPASPDAIDYNDGGLWVQDWLLWKGTHTATGINIKLHVHNLYRFDKSGKINSIHQFFNNDIFEEITKSQMTIEEGVVYKYHPFIGTVRKLINAYCAKDLDSSVSFYTSNATFSILSGKYGEVTELEAHKDELRKTFNYYNTINLEQSGHPICICYSKQYYVVNSWWVLSYTNIEGKKNSNIPVMFSHGFDKDGKITWESMDVSSNHFN